VADAMLRITATSPADLAIVQMQDVLRLGPSSRMNFPGTPSGNWRWRLDPGSPTRADARRLRELAEAAGRVPG
jgi:4-alpha-glucanotransferase